MSKIYNTIVEVIQEENNEAIEIAGLLGNLLRLQERQIEEMKSQIILPFNR